ncbi:MAG: dTDP-4-dehydrorhamnose reductase [Syntrophobacteraceae bacterium]|nr:dTDP-4-dehydrorhamnose reductase [Syntrophobacteraceae bacterium]
MAVDRSVIVIGSSGMLGADLMEALHVAGMRAVALRRPDIDISRPESIRSALGGISSPGLVINCAAYTAVDKAESEPEAAMAANREGPAHLADACRRVGIPLIHVSTDYVFDGKANRPYTEEDAVNPLNVYGLSKLQGEEAVRTRIFEHLIVRTSWLYGAGGQNFVKTMLRLGFEREELKVVCDQYGCPTWTFDLARCLVRMAQRVLSDSRNVRWGAYHFCGKGKTTWYRFASAILEEANRRKPRPGGVANVLPIPSSEYPTAAARPKYSVLDCAKIEAAFGVSPPEWKKSLARCMDRLLISRRAPGEQGFLQ